MMIQAKVIFDNGGGVTVQVRTWKGGQVHHAFGHWFNDPEQAAQLIFDAFHMGDPSQLQLWEGNESEALTLEVSEEDQHNGGYRSAIYNSWNQVVEDISEDDPWANVRAWDTTIQRLAEAHASVEFILTDDNAIERAATLEEAAAIAEDWYDYLVDEGRIPDACNPDLDSSDLDSLNESISEWHERIAEAAGKKDFAGHGNYLVTAGDRMGLTLRVTAEKVYA
jgi:hypothetical protein